MVFIEEVEGPVRKALGAKFAPPTKGATGEFGAFVVAGAGWEDANGCYAPTGKELFGAPVFENDHKCLLSRESHANSRTGKTSYGWIIGQDRRPLYGVETDAKTPPSSGWLLFAGSSPVPKLQGMGSAPDAATLAAQTWKDQGNAYFSAQKYHEAEAKWTRGLCLADRCGDETIPVALYSNRAEVRLRLKMWAEALDDAQAALRRNATHEKALLRGAVAARELKNYGLAQDLVQQCLDAHPNSPEAKQLLLDLEQLVHFSSQTAAGDGKLKEQWLNKTTEDNLPRAFSTKDVNSKKGFKAFGGYASSRKGTEENDGLEFTGPMDSDVGEKGPAKQVAPRASFVSRAFVRHPCKILWLTNLLLVACSTLGVLLAEAPDFAQANKGFEPRGTELADRYNAIRQVVAYPRHRYCGYLCPRDEGFVRMLSDGKAEALRRGDAEPLAPAPARRLQGGDERGLLGNLVVSCYAQLAIVKPAAFLVLQSSEEADLLSPELLRDLCEAGAVVEESAAYTDRCQTFQGACCPLLTLPRALAFLQLALQQQASGSQASPAAGRVLAEPRLGCGELGDVALALQRYAQCSEALLSGACDRGSFMCAEASLAASCEAINPMVNLLMMYMATRGWQPPSALTTTGLVLPVEDEGHYEVYYDLQNELPQYFSGETSLQIVAMQLREKFPLFQRRLFLDSAWAVLAAVVGMTCMILHTRSVFISLMTSLQVTLGMTFSYFLFRIVFQAPFFTFLNMNMLFCAVAIGIDDVFVFMDAYRQSYYFLAPETDVEGRMEWTFRRAFGAMLVTTLTTSVAFSANIMSPITVVKNFGAFAAIVIITDFVCMMLVLPSALIISEFGILKDFCRCCGSWNRPMPEVWAQKSQRHIVERFFEEKVARVIVLGRWFFVFVLTILGVVAITQTLGLKSSNAEALQLFVDSHLVERFDQYWSAEFQWFADFRSGMGLPVNIVAGVLPADAGDYQDPDNFGPMERAPEDLTSAASQLWYAELCTRLPSAPFFRRLYRGGCLFDGVRRYAGGGCNNLDTPCCPQAQPQSWPLASERLSQCALEYAAFGELYGHAGRQLSDSAAARRELAASVLAEAENLKGRYNWGQGVAFDEEGRLIAMVFGYDSSEAYTANVELLGAFYDTVESWATGALDAPSGVPRPFWWTGQLGWYALMKGLQDGAYSAAGAALGFCLAVLLLVVGNVVMAFYALVTILFVLSLVIWCLIGCGWVLDLNTAVVLAICVGMCVDFVCHMSHAYVEAPTGEGGESWPAERFRRTTHALGTMGISVTFGAGSTLLGGSAMFPAQVKFFFQFGTFLVFTMFWSLLYAVFYFPALSAVAGVAGHFGDLRTIVVGLRALCGCGPKVAVSPEGEASATSGKMKISRVTPTEE